MTALINDIKYAFRVLQKNPGFTFIVITILALGIGTNTTIFSVINAVLLRPLPFDEPERIVRIYERRLQQGIDRIGSSYMNLVYWREHNQVFEHISGMQNRRAYITGMDRSYHVKACAVSSCFFALMGAQPLHGRGFLPEEEQAGKEQVVVLSYSFWCDHLGSDPKAVGGILTLDNKPHTIVGIMPADFRSSLYRDIPFWVPLVLDPERRGGGTNVWARLKRGVTLEQAQADMDVLETRIVQRDPEHFAGYTVGIQRFLDDELGDKRTMLYVLWGAVGLVLLIACTNAAGLFLVHGHVRHQEMAIRAALGATRVHIMRYVFTEGLILSLFASVVGLVGSFCVLKGVIGLCPANIPRLNEARIDITVLMVTLGISIGTGLLFSLIPAWEATGVHLCQSMKKGQRNMSSGRRWRYARFGLIVSQIGVAMTLLVSVGMLIQSLIAMQKVDLGFKPEKVVVVSIELPKVNYPERTQWLAFYQDLLQRVQAQPGVQSAALASGGLVLGTSGGYMEFSIDGKSMADSQVEPYSRYVDVSCDFFETMGMRIIKGRGFTDQDTLNGSQTLIIDENLARKYFPEEDPLGQRINGVPIAGVVASLKDFEDLSPDIVTIYKPISQFCYLTSDLIVKTERDPLLSIDILRAQVSALDKDLAIAKVRTLESILAEMLATRRFTTLLLGFFVQIALVLAAVGLFGLLQYAVTHATREIGIRMALGATPASIRQSFLRQGIWLVLPGIGIGLLGGYTVSRAITSLLFQSEPTDLGMLAITVGALLSVALLACYLPARRAAKVDPMEALRHE